MKKLNVLILAGVLVGAVALPAEARWNQRGNLRNEIQRDREELRDSRQEFLRDRRDYREDKRELRRDHRSEASPEEIARDRAELRESRGELRDSRREFYQDRRELERDLNAYNWRYNDRYRSSSYGWRDDRYDRYDYRRDDDRGWWQPRSWWDWR